jgi:isoleucyl-tRNA synthetase
LIYKEVNNPIHFPDLEKEILDFWEKNQIFRKSVESRPSDRSFIFYEGPPTANGKPGIHHVISRSIKDFVCRYQTMKGYSVNRKAGWDTHGLPVEIEIEKEMDFQKKDQIEAYGVDKFNQECRESVFRYVKEWNELTRRIGYWVDLDNPYITYTNDYIETVWWLLAQMWKKGFIYQGFKILPYCPRCETPLSSHEISLGYEDVTERSVIVKFRLIDGERRFILAWTTTPWTLPGNVALAAGADILYVEVEQENNGLKETYYIAENQIEMLSGEYQIKRKLLGKELEGWKYQPLFEFVNLEDDEHPAYFLALADFVTTEEGTGVVHTAVMYGEDDYRLGMKIGLPAKHTVDEKGCFNDRVPKWQGEYVKDPELENKIVDYLQEQGLLYKEEQYTHSYPYCWRCHSPLLYYAKKSWYLRTTAVRDQLIENNKKIQWYPREVGAGRFGQWLENNVDWAFSRDRYWGTPLNIWICPSCHKQQTIESIEELKKLSGLKEINNLHKPYIDEVTIPCPTCDEAMQRTPEVIDCWFDSGAMPYAQCHYPFEKDCFENNFPADFIAEGVDQTRGWFYSLLAISTMISGVPSYKSCISIELILDKEGQKMSKTKGNTVDPFSILDTEGSDPLRWYLFTVSPPWIPTRFDPEGIREVKRKFFGTLANTYSFFVLYANIDGFQNKERAVPIEERPEIDRWLLSSMNSMIKKVNIYLERYDVTKSARTIQEFVIDDLSNWYVRRNRRRFWKAEMGKDKISAYQTLYEVLLTISKLIAPFSPFFAEDIFQNLNSVKSEAHESVHLSYYPDPKEKCYQYINEALEEKMKSAREVVSLCRSARNEAGIKVRQPLERIIIITSGKHRREAIQAMDYFITEEVNVRKIEFVENLSSIMIKRAKPVFQKLGPKFGSQVNKVAKLIKQLGNEEIEHLENGENIHVNLDQNQDGLIVLEDIEIYSEPHHGFVLQADSDLTVARDTQLNDDLIAEGLTREFVNRIQHMRKEACFDVTDRIRVYYDATENIRKSICSKEDYVREEILAISLDNNFKQGEFYREWEFEGEKIKIGLERISS